MRKIYLVFILLSFVNCKEQSKIDSIEHEEPLSQNEIIRMDEVYIRLNDTSASFTTNLRVDEFQDRPDFIEMGRKYGRLSITIPTQNNISILGGDSPASYRYDLELERGDSVNIDIEQVSLDNKNVVNIPIFHISNSDKNWSEYNFASLLYKKNIRTKAIGIDSTKSFFFTYWKSEEIYKNANTLLDSLKSEQQISEKFYIDEKNNQKHEFAIKRMWQDKLLVKEEGNSLLIGDLQFALDKEDQTENSSFISMLRQVIDFQHFNSNRRELNSRKFDFVLNTSTFLEGELKIAVLDAYLKSIFLLEKNKFPAYLEKFNQINSNPELKEKWNTVLANLEQNQTKLNSTNRNIAILLNLVNDNELTFEEILKNQKGKVVLVDFWASWCVPCIKEMPSMKKVKSIFEKDKFQVIEISIDKDYAAWERASKLYDLNIEDQSYFITNWDESNLYKTYGIKTIPRYLLFDKEGKIISEDAPRPSSEDLIELIKTNI